MPFYSALDNIVVRNSVNWSTDTIVQCASAFWYTRAQAQINQALSWATKSVVEMEQLRGNVRTNNSMVGVLAKQLRAQLALIMQKVRTSPLFEQPAGDLFCKDKRLMGVISTVSTTAVCDVIYQQYCAAQLSAAELHNGVSDAHTLYSDCWAESVTMMDICLKATAYVGIYDADEGEREVRNRQHSCESAKDYAQLAEGVVKDAIAYHAAAQRASRTGHIEVARLYTEAADMQVQIGTYILTGMKDTSTFDFNQPFITDDEQFTYMVD